MRINCESASYSVFFFLLTIGHIRYLFPVSHEFLNNIQDIVYKRRINAKIDFIFPQGE